MWGNCNEHRRIVQLTQIFPECGENDETLFVVGRTIQRPISEPCNLSMAGPLHDFGKMRDVEAGGKPI